jgi:hypothetical protein
MQNVILNKEISNRLFIRNRSDGHRLQFRLENNIVFLSGVIGNQRQLAVIEQDIASMPGIIAVVDEGVQIEALEEKKPGPQDGSSNGASGPSRRSPSKTSSLLPL